MWAGEAWLAGCQRAPGGAAAAGLQEERSSAGGRGRRFRGQTCGRRAPGTVEGARGRRPGERRSARGGTRGVCAGGTGRAVRVCACARRACPAVLKDTSGRRRRSRCPGDVTARPSIIARCPSRARIRAEATAAAAAGAGTVAPGPAWPSRSWAPTALTPRTLGSQRARGVRGLARLSSWRPHALLRPGQRRAGPAGAEEEAGTGGAGSGGGSGRGAAGGGSSRPGRVTALGAGRGGPGQRPPWVSRLSTNGSSAFSSAPAPAPARGEDELAGLKKTLVFISEHRDSFFEPHSLGARGSGRGGDTAGGEQLQRIWRCPVGTGSAPLGGPREAAGRAHARSPPRLLLLLAEIPWGSRLRGRPQRARLGPPPCCGRERRVGSSELGADPGWSPRKHRRRGAAPPPRPPRAEDAGAFAAFGRGPHASRSRGPDPGPAARRCLRAPLRVHSGP